jgi:4-hydroxybenzoate polyprenyltransferase
MMLCSTDVKRQEPAGLRDYIRIARLDHATKHLFIVPGVVLGAMLRGVRVENIYLSALLGLITAIAIASANYAINEFLDREFDRHHPAKLSRAAVRREMKGTIVFLEWLILIMVGLGSALLHSRLMFFVALIFALQGVFYNVRPLRTKDKAYLDVASESINNPVRLVIGWAMVDPTSLPPCSLILAYWCGGAFLMGAKRLSEFRDIAASHGLELLTSYRASFKGYTETSLAASCLSYALLSVSFLSIFLIKYRIEFILLLPFITALFVFYFSLACQPGSTAQKPERLFREKRLMLILAAVIVVFAFTSEFSIPWLEPLTSQHYVELK